MAAMISVLFFLSSFLISGFVFLCHASDRKKCVQHTAAKSGLLISRLDKENFYIKQRKLRIS